MSLNNSLIKITCNGIRTEKNNVLPSSIDNEAPRGLNDTQMLPRRSSIGELWLPWARERVPQWNWCIGIAATLALIDRLPTTRICHYTSMPPGVASSWNSWH